MLPNNGRPTYYFRGNVTNNYVSFAGYTWRIVRVNEDGTVRLIMSNEINNNTEYQFNSLSSEVINIYYSESGESGIKYYLDTWYVNNIEQNGYSSKVAKGNYFCEQAKVSLDSDYSTNSGADMIAYNNYEPNFMCENDANGYGLVNASIGLITYDEAMYAGGYFDLPNNSYYLYRGMNYWTMSPAGVSATNATAWIIYTNGILHHNNVTNYNKIRPVINLKADVTATGLGTEENVPERIV